MNLARERTLASMLNQMEWHIARLIADEASDSEIARQLQIPESSVVRHLLHIFYKCHVLDRIELSAYVRRADTRLR
jgi:DNA-binding NarL/FixJ family response regulator